MERRPLRHQPFSTLWKILFLVVMELGIRNDLVDPDTGTPHEENDEEEELAEDPEIVPDHSEGDGGSGSDNGNSAPLKPVPEPEEELNPDGASSGSFGPPDGNQQGGQHDDVQISTMNGSAPGDFVMACEEELDSGFPPYNPFDRPPGEIIVQVLPRSRSRSARRPRSV